MKWRFFGKKNNENSLIDKKSQYFFFNYVSQTDKNHKKGCPFFICILKH